MNKVDTIPDKMAMETSIEEPPQARRKSFAQKVLSNKLKYFTAAAIFYGNITLGCLLDNYGPALTSLQVKYRTDDATISQVFTIFTGGIMLGALSVGFIFRYVNRQLAVIAILMIQALVLFLTPYCPTLNFFFISAAILGIASGSYDTAQMVWVLEMMQKDCPPFVQGQQFFIALGTTLPALIMAPFLEHEELDKISASSLTNKPLLEIPYFILGGLVSLAALVQLLLFTFLRYHPPPPEKSLESTKQSSEAQVDKTQNTARIGKWPLAKFVRVILCGAYTGAVLGMEWGIFQFFSKFAQNSELRLSESDAAYALTGMTTAFTVGRAIAIIAVFKVPTQFLLWINISLIVAANVILMLWANTSLNMLWASAVLFGLGLSSMYGGFSAYMERYLNITDGIGSVMIVCGSTVAAVYPLVVGNFIEHNVIVLSYTTFLSIGIVIPVMATLNYLTYKDKTRY